MFSDFRMHVIGVPQIAPEFGVGKVPPLACSKRRPNSARLFIAAVEENDVAVRLEALRHQLDRGCPCIGAAVAAITHTGAEWAAFTNND